MRTHHRRTDADGQLRHTPGAPHPRLSEDQIRAVYRFIYQRVGNREDAESLTERACSEALCFARDRADKDKLDLDELLWRTAHAVVAEHLRWFYDSSTAAEDIPSERQADAPAQVHEILARLPTQERDFLARRFLGADLLDEAADALGMTRSDALATQWLALMHAARIAHEEKSCSTC